MSRSSSVSLKKFSEGHGGWRSFGNLQEFSGLPQPPCWQTPPVVTTLPLDLRAVYFLPAPPPTTLESPCKEIKPVNPKGNQPWTFIRRTEAEAPILWTLDMRSRLTGKDLMLGKIEGKRRREWQRMRWLDGISDSMDMSLSKRQEIEWRTGKPGMLQSMGSQRIEHDFVTKQHFAFPLCVWTERRGPLLISLFGEGVM